MPMTSGLKAISLFSGAMGLDIGLEESGVEIRLAVDCDAAAAATIRANRPRLAIIQEDLYTVSSHDLQRTFGTASPDIIVGGPPCQAFSVYGRRRGIEDHRGAVIYEFARVVEDLRPKFFALENVRGFLSMSLPPSRTKGSLLGSLVDRFNQSGYRVDLFVVNSVNYGAPQIRERLLLIGNRVELEARFPVPTHSNRPRDGLLPFATLGDALAGFHDANPEVMDFSPRKKAYLAQVPPGGNWRLLPLDVQKEAMGKSWYLKGGRSAHWRKLTFEFPCPTLVTMPNHAGTSMCHPIELRALSVGEYARIQEFPPDWQFAGTTTDKYRLIGNAVPVRLGRILGDTLREMQLRNVRGETDDADLLLPYREIHLRPHVRTRYYYRNGTALPPTPYYEQTGTQVRLPMLTN
jgi:DNA (cytosine-5)-methyltransferase 1